jgi:transcription elongation factor Elf1
LDDEELILWQDVLDEVAARRAGDLTCPYCHKKPLEVTEEGGKTRIACRACGKYLEGRFGFEG